eukprot:5170904-Prymnesium_polylepis.1
MSGCSDIRARVQMSRRLSRFIFDMAPPENQALIEKIIATNSARASSVASAVHSPSTKWPGCSP